MAALFASLVLAGAVGLPRPELPPSIASWVDRGRIIEALPSREHADPGLVAIKLRYNDGRVFDAAVDDTAIIETNDIDAAEHEQALHRAELLMPSRGMWLVRGRPGETGVDIAARVPGAIPNLYLHHRIWNETRKPNDPKYPGQWFFSDLKLPEAWALEWGSADVGIAVVDTGCDTNHEDLHEKFDRGRDVLDGDDDPSVMSTVSGAAHGTACSGLVAAETDNNNGVSGACPMCRLHCVRLLPIKDAAIPLSKDVAAFQFAIDVGAAVISNSWGYSDPLPVPGPLATAIELAFDTGRGGKGAVVVFASGNDDREVGNDELLAVRGVLGVGAINHYQELTQYSNRGDSVDLVAPTGTLTTDITGINGDTPGDYTELFGGTSSACPIAAGVAGLVISAAPDLTSAEVEDLLVKNVSAAFYAEPDESGHDKKYGYGVLNPVAAVKAALGVTDTPDAGTPDAGNGSDAGLSDGSGGDASSGCGCTGSAGSALALLALVTRRRARAGAA